MDVLTDEQRALRPSNRVICIKGSKRGFAGQVVVAPHGSVRIVVEGDHGREISSGRDRWRLERPEDLRVATDLPALQGDEREVVLASRIREHVLAEADPGAYVWPHGRAPYARDLSLAVWNAVSGRLLARFWIDNGVDRALKWLHLMMVETLP